MQPSKDQRNIPKQVNKSVCIYTYTIYIKYDSRSLLLYQGGQIYSVIAFTKLARDSGLFHLQNFWYSIQNHVLSDPQRIFIELFRYTLQM